MGTVLKGHAGKKASRVGGYTADKFRWLGGLTGHAKACKEVRVADVVQWLVGFVDWVWRLGKGGGDKRDFPVRKSRKRNAEKE